MNEFVLIMMWIILTVSVWIATSVVLSGLAITFRKLHHRRRKRRNEQDMVMRYFRCMLTRNYFDDSRDREVRQYLRHVRRDPKEWDLIVSLMKQKSYYENMAMTAGTTAFVLPVNSNN
jgi:hypothetical protein